MNLVLDARSVNHFVVPVTAQIDSITIENGLDGQVVTLLFIQDGTGHSVAAGSGNLQNFLTPSPSPLAVTAESFVCNARANTWVNADSALSAKFRTKRVSHTITQGEVDAGFAGPIAITWDTSFPDASYTVGQAIQDTTAGGASSNDYSPGDFHDLANTGFNTAIYVGPGAAAGEVVVIHSIGIHD